MIKKEHISHLSKVDKVLANVINKHNAPKISESKDLVLDLYKYIIFQQISTKAGNSIFNRFFDYYKKNQNSISSWTELEWKSIGLSNQKKVI